MARIRANKPLKHKRVLITRPQEQAQPFIDLLEEQEADPIVFSTIRIVPPRSWEEVDKSLERLAAYDTVIFTSANGVRYFFERLDQKRIGAESLKNRTICAIGPMTAASLKQHGFENTIVPEKFQAESIIDALNEHGIAGRRFLLPRAEEARSTLPEEIQKRGGAIDVVTVYRTKDVTGDPERLHALLTTHRIDVITFTSSSTVKNFVALLSEEVFSKLSAECTIACIGPITADTAASYGLKPDIVAEEYTIEGLTRAMVEYFGQADDSRDTE